MHQDQPKYADWPAGPRIRTYRGDFSYFTDKGRVVEDVKGFATPVYRLKKKLIEAAYPGLKIIEVTK